MKDEAPPTAPLLEETFAQTFGVLGAQLVAIRQQGEKRYKKSPAYKQERKAARASNRKPSKRVSYTDEEEEALQVIEVRAKELRRVEHIVSADPELMNLVEASIEIQVRAAQRRQTRISIAVAGVAVIVGWLLSALGSATALAQLLAR